MSELITRPNRRRHRTRLRCAICGCPSFAPRCGQCESRVEFQGAWWFLGQPAPAAGEQKERR